MIDDQFKEAEPLLSALWAGGVPAIYLAGDLRPRGTPKASGVRVVFLDLNLDRTTSHGNLNATLGILDDRIDLTQSGIGIVYWTKSPEDISTFKYLLTSRLTHFKPAFLLPQEKTAYLAERSAIGSLIESLTTTLQAQQSHSFLCSWEAAVLKGACDTSQSLFLPAMDEPTRLGVLAALANAAGGQAITTPEQAISSLCESMHEMLSDAVPPKEFLNDLQRFGPTVCTALGQLKKSRIDDAERGRLNRLLLLDPAPSDMSCASPGCVLTDKNALSCNPGREFSAKASRGELLEYFPCTVREEVFTGTEEARKEWRESQKRQMKDEIDAAAPACVQVTINVTPPCDHAQQKQRLQSRFLGGMLVPITSATPKRLSHLSAETRVFAKEIGPFELRGVSDVPDGTYLLVLNARQLFTLSSAAATFPPAFGLRTSVVSDVLAWFAGHAARPGIISV